jgi:hypothetical protein
MRVVRTHYSADPLKRTDEWKQRASEGMNKRDWAREYEIDWTIAEGLGVYADDFDRQFHVAEEQITTIPDVPIVTGFDFGLNPCVVFGQVTAGGCLMILHEVVTWDGRGEQKQSGLDRLMADVTPWANMMYRDNDWQSDAWVDPAGYTRDQSNEKTCVQVLSDYGIYAQPGAVSFEERRAAVSRLLNSNVGGKPRILISPTCHMIIEGLQGAYQFRKAGMSSVGGVNNYIFKPAKNAWSHPLDALSYLITGVFGLAGIVEEQMEDEDRPKEPNWDRAYY